MKYQVVVDTPKGVLFTKVVELSEEEVDEAKYALSRVVESGDRFSVETEDGVVFMSGEMIKQSLFMLKTLEK